ncbi:MAG TPA: GntR family transcriptional regulator [Candidatus Cloacimonadota bacterium]|nr:GntR family transcriptional regulator [Candidatus Cloacimonadota bacterium]
MNVIISNSSENPIYKQIYDQFRNQIVTGILKEGEALPSIRKLAREINVSVITTKKAYDDLERDGFVASVGGKGTFVSSQSLEFLREQKMKMVEEKLAEAVAEAKILGLTCEETEQMLELLFREE